MIASGVSEDVYKTIEHAENVCKNCGEGVAQDVQNVCCFSDLRGTGLRTEMAPAIISSDERTSASQPHLVKLDSRKGQTHMRTTREERLEVAGYLNSSMETKSYHAFEAFKKITKPLNKKEIPIALICIIGRASWPHPVLKRVPRNRYLLLTAGFGMKMSWWWRTCAVKL